MVSPDAWAAFIGAKENTKVVTKLSESEELQLALEQVREEIQSDRRTARLTKRLHVIGWFMMALVLALGVFVPGVAPIALGLPGGLGFIVLASTGLSLVVSDSERDTQLERLSRERRLTLLYHTALRSELEKES